MRIVDVIAHVAMASGRSYAELVGMSMATSNVYARQVAMYVAANMIGASSAEIGRAFNRDGSTVRHGLDRVREEIKTDKQLASFIHHIMAALEYRDAVAQAAHIDVLAVARNVSANPRRVAVQVTTHEIIALSRTVVDLWEIASASEAALRMIDDNNLQSIDTETAAQFWALRGSILNEIEELAGPSDTVAAEERTQT